jgi:hypothetical protein
MFLGSKVSVSRLSRQCGFLNISKPYTRSPEPVTGTALLFFICLKLNSVKGN